MKRDILLTFLGFLALAGAAFWLADASYDPLSLLFSKERALSLEGSLEIAQELDRIADRLEAPALPRDNLGLVLLAAEIVPFYHYENISDRGAVPIVGSIRWELRPPDHERNFHNLGVCSLGEHPRISLNARFINWASAWYTKDYFSTLVHELGHSQGIYKLNDTSTEPATQLATVEVLAAMASGGNVWALPAFVREVQGYAEDYAWSLALKENRLGLIRDHIRRTGDDIFAEARFERSLRHWKSDMSRLKTILRNYGEAPYRLMVKALNRPSRLTDRLEPFPNAIHCIILDDTYYALRHLYQMAEDYPGLLEDYHKTHEE